MERQNLVIFTAPYYYPQMAVVPTPSFNCYYSQTPFQENTPKRCEGSFKQMNSAYTPQIVPTNGTQIYSYSQYGYAINEGDEVTATCMDSQLLSNTKENGQLPHREHEIRFYQSTGAVFEKDSDLFIPNNPLIQHQNNFIREIKGNPMMSSNISAKLSTTDQQFEIQQHDNPVQYESSLQYTTDSTRFEKIEYKQEAPSEQSAPEKKQQQSKKRLTATWKVIHFNKNVQPYQHIPLIWNIKNAQPIKGEHQNESQMKLQPEDLSELSHVSSYQEHNQKKKEIEREELQENCHPQTIKTEIGLNDSLSKEESKVQENCDSNKDEHINGNLCKNLMRAFNKFVQNYNFLDPSIRVSLFRFLERNTYSNLQMLKIYHNPRYKHIFMEFVKEGAKQWLQHSKVIDLNAHISLLEKIIQGDVSMVGIKKRKNVSKKITTNLKKKSLPLKTTLLHN